MMCDSCEGEVEMEVEDTDEDRYSHRTGHYTVPKKLWVCPKCDNTEEFVVEENYGGD
jgi:hypothetical protein